MQLNYGRENGKLANRLLTYSNNTYSILLVCKEVSVV